MASCARAPEALGAPTAITVLRQQPRGPLGSLDSPFCRYPFPGRRSGRIHHSHSCQKQPLCVCRWLSGVQARGVQSSTRLTAP